MMKVIRYLFVFLTLSLFLMIWGCASLEGKTSEDPGVNLQSVREKPKDATVELSPIQRKLVEGAYRLVGYRGKRIVVRGRSFNFDCTGTILAIYYYAGIDLSRAFSKYTGNGVLRLYKIFYHKGLLYLTKRPKSGDLIFWDNTYDRNGNGKMDDYLTHVGMVVGVYKDGTIEYVHEHIRKGITIERMNLYTPNTYGKRVNGKFIIVNAPIRMKVAGKTHPNKWLASQLLRAFGKGYLYR